MPGFVSDASGAAFERKMTRAEGAGAFGEDGEDAAGSEEVLTELHGGGVGGAVALVFVANDGDAGEEDFGEKISAKLCGDEKSGAREDGFVDPAIHGAVAMKGDEECGTGKARGGGEGFDAGEVETGAETGEELIPEVWHEIEFTMGKRGHGGRSWRELPKTEFGRR